MRPLAGVAAVLIGFLCGALPWGLWLGRAFRGVDVRTVGSRNLGATNVYRSLGPGLGVATLALDIAKGALPVALLPATPLGAAFPGGPAWAAMAVGLAAVLGHVFTPFAGFHGGKGVATMVGVLLALAPLAFAVFVVVFVLTLAITRYVSLGSMLGAIAFAGSLAVVEPGGARSPLFGFGLVVALLVIARHHENIRRLARGTERRFEFRAGSRP